MRNLTYPLSLVFLIIGIALAVWMPQERNLMADRLIRWTYPILMLLVLLWLWILLRLLKDHRPILQASFSQSQKGLLVAFLLASLIFLSVPPAFRVFDDEINLVATSKSLLLEKRADKITSGAWVHERFIPEKRSLDKRPFLFPFAMQIIHAFTGYRPSNAFVLNFLVLVALFFILYDFLERRFQSPLWALSGTLLVAAQPIVSQCATSGIFDPFYVLFFTLGILALKFWMENKTPVSFEWFWLNGLMLAHIRRESFIYLPFLGILLVILREIRWETIKKSALVISLTPILFLPVIWQRLTLPIDPQIGTKPMFLLKAFLENNALFFKHLFDFRFYLPYANVVNLIGLLGLGTGLWLLGTSKEPFKNPVLRKWLLIVLMTVFLSWGILTSYYWAQMTNFFSSRFYLSFSILLSLSAIFFIRWLWPPQKSALWIFLISLFMFIAYHPIAMSNRFAHAGTVQDYYRIVHDTLKRWPTRDFLLICERPNEFVIHDIGSIGFGSANRNRQKILRQYRDKVFDSMLVVQEILKSDGKPTQRTRLDKSYKLVTFYEHEFTGKSRLRFSKVAR